MKAANTFDFKQLPVTRATASVITQTENNDFVSLRQHLIDQGLRSFTDAELSQIMAEELEYEPEDSLIVDAYMTSVLNQNREVQIGDKMYQFFENGLVIYDAQYAGKIDLTPVRDVEVEPGTTTTITVGFEDDGEGDSDGMAQGGPAHPTPPVQIVGINYGNQYNNNDAPVVDDNGNPYPEEEEYIPVITRSGVEVPRDNINRAYATYVEGKGAWFFGTNITVTNKFNSDHRMKLRMFDVNYIFYRAVGMTVRMQKRLFRIWWRKKAQEFDYGWSPIDCEYTFEKPPFSNPPLLPDGRPQYDKYPTAMKKDWPFLDTKAVLFHVPLTNFDITKGTLNSAIAGGLKAMEKQVKNWFNDPSNSAESNNPRGVFALSHEDKTMRVIFPAGVDFATGKGREEVDWDEAWFDCYFVLGFSSNGNSFHFSPKFPTSTKDVKIKRGEIQASVKYNNEWRACTIRTKQL